MADLGPWNYAIAFAFMISGLLLTMRWRWVQPYEFNLVGRYPSATYGHPITRM